MLIILRAPPPPSMLVFSRDVGAFGAKINIEKRGGERAAAIFMFNFLKENGHKHAIFDAKHGKKSKIHCISGRDAR